MNSARRKMLMAPAPSVDAAPGGGGTPAAPPSSEWVGGVQPPAVPQRSHTLPPRDPATGQFTEADLIAAREQAAREVEERLNGRFSTLEQNLSTLTTEREAMLEERRQRETQEAQEAEARRQAELSATERLAEQQQRLEAQQREFEEQLRLRDTLLQKEQEYQNLQSYKAQRLAQEGNLILPALHDLVVGSSEEEIDASIAALKAKTEDTVALFSNQQVADQQQQQYARQQMRGVAPTGLPPVGPLDNTSGQTLVTASDVDAMDNATYAANREALLRAARISGPYGRQSR